MRESMWSRCVTTADGFWLTGIWAARAAAQDVRGTASQRTTAKKRPFTRILWPEFPIPGIAHAIGYANESGIPFARPFIKYTPTWPRSFMPQNQSQRNLIAKMKLIPVECPDS